MYHPTIERKMETLRKRYFTEMSELTGAQVLIDGLGLRPLLDDATGLHASIDYINQDGKTVPLDRFHVIVTLDATHKPKYRSLLISALDSDRIDTWIKRYHVQRNYGHRYGGWDLQECWAAATNDTDVQGIEGFDFIHNGAAYNRLTVIFESPAEAGQQLPFVYKRDKDGNRIRHRCTIGTHTTTPAKTPETHLAITCAR